MSEQWVFQDWSANRHDRRIQLILAMFRLAQRMSVPHKDFRVAGKPYLWLYRVVVHCVLHIELQASTEVGRGLTIFHGYGLVVHPTARLGQGVVLRQCVTIGNRTRGGAAPVIEDGVEIGANALVLGPITVGKNAVVGAGAVVLRSVPENAVVVGNPARVIKYRIPRECDLGGT